MSGFAQRFSKYNLDMGPGFSDGSCAPMSQMSPDGPLNTGDFNAGDHMDLDPKSSALLWAQTKGAQSGMGGLGKMLGKSVPFLKPLFAAHDSYNAFTDERLQDESLLTRGAHAMGAGALSMANPTPFSFDTVGAWTGEQKD